MLVVGLTGNYGMGKSTVLPLFQKLGALTLDTDVIVKSLLTEEDVLEKIRGLLGDEVFYRNGSLNKRKVARMVFKDDALRRSLEDILHPLVFERINIFIRKNAGKARIVVIEVPLLFERGYENRFNRTITVYSREEKALSRLEKQGIKRQETLQRLKSQLPIEDKIRRFDFIIDNNRSIKETNRQVKEIYQELLKEGKDGHHNRY